MTGVDLGALIRRARESAGMTQGELARLSGTSERTVRNVERSAGRPRSMSVELIIAALRAKGAEVSEPREPLGDQAPAVLMNQLAPIHQLPADIVRFTGRARNLDELDAVLTAHERDPGKAKPIVIAAVGGAGGMGKTALAVHWAHEAADRFPDGQLYLNLRGFGPGEPLDPSVALVRMLRSLGVQGADIPDDDDARSALLRSTLAGRRMMLLLDNARDTAQVRPLLPGSDIVVLVTSRNQLRGLTIREGAHAIRLDQLSPAESVALLQAAVPGIAAVTTALLGELADLCGHLPLALAVAAERLRHETHADPRALVDELRDEQARLDLLRADDLDSDLRAVFSWSYRALPEAAARLFRLLAVQPGADIGVPAAAALAGSSVAEAGALLTTLASAHQVQHKTPGRYEQHDLVRAYGRELAFAADETDDTNRALLRLGTWYLATVRTARTRLAGRASRTDRPLPHTATPDPLEFDDPQAAARWCDVELVNLLATMRHLAAHGPVGLAAQFAPSLWAYFNLRSDWKNWAEAFDIGLADARRAGDVLIEAWTLNGLGIMNAQQQRYEDAARHLELALAAFERADVDPRGTNAARANLGNTYREMGRFDLARDHLLAAYHRATTDDQSDVRASAGVNLAQVHIESGRPTDAIPVCREALVIYRSADDRCGEGDSLNTLGRAYRATGAVARAITCHNQAVAIFQEMSGRGYEADAHSGLAEALQEAGRTQEAAAAWQLALTLFDQVGDPRAELVRTHVATQQAGESL